MTAGKKHNEPHKKIPKTPHRSASPVSDTENAQPGGGDVPSQARARIKIHVKPVVMWALAGGVFFGGAFGIYRYMKTRPEPWLNQLTLSPVKPAYFHHEFAAWTLKTNNQRAIKALKDIPLWSWVEKDGKILPTVGETEKVRLSFNRKTGAWQAKWPVPWNLPDGKYQICMATASFPPDMPRLVCDPLVIESREFKPMPAGFGVLTLENLVNLRRLEAPDGTRGVYALAEWARFIGADALWVQGAESSGYNSIPKDDFPWHVQPDKDLKELGRECHKRGIKLGVYELSYLVGGPAKYTPHYQYGWYLTNGRVVNGLDLPKRRGVSILDPKRPRDIAKLLKRWCEIEEIDFLGMDYLRPAFGGSELADDFVRDMPGVETPADWAKMPKEARMLWVARHLHLAPTQAQSRLPKYAVAEKWFWYRAHRTAGVVQSIVREVGHKKPLWAFTLSWQKGWEHGQDPVMMRDAGVDMDAIMLYEATGEQFRNLVKQWGEYVLQKQVNLLGGDVVDWNLHQKTLNPAGPEDYMGRNLLAATGFHKDAPMRGMFVHDFYRAKRGRLGPYGTREWLLAGGAAITRLRELHSVLPYEVKFNTPEFLRAHETVKAHYRVTKLSQVPVHVEVFTSPDLKAEPRAFSVTGSTAPVAIALEWSPGAASAARGNRPFVAVRSARPQNAAEKCQIHIKYLPVHLK